MLDRAAHSAAAPGRFKDQALLVPLVQRPAHFAACSLAASTHCCYLTQASRVSVDSFSKDDVIVSPSILRCGRTAPRAAVHKEGHALPLTAPQLLRAPWHLLLAFPCCAAS